MEYKITTLQNSKFTYDDVVELIHKSFSERRKEGIVFLITDITTEDFEKRFSNDTILVAEDETDGKLIGTASIDYRYNRGVKYGYLRHLAIHPNFQGKGIGKVLIIEHDKMCIENGCNYCESDTAVNATSSVKSHLKSGQIIVGLKSFAGTDYYSYVFRKYNHNLSLMERILYKLRFILSCIYTYTCWNKTGYKRLLFRSPRANASRIYHKLFNFYYINIKTPRNIKHLRKQPTVKVLFLLYDLPMWKTESLYLAMLKHPRFEPIIGVCPHREIPDGENDVKKYCEGKKYEYIDISANKTLYKQTSADVIFVQKPYVSCFHKLHEIRYNTQSLYCFVLYYFHDMIEDWNINDSFLQQCWQHYFENKELVKQYSMLCKNNGRNMICTGTPQMDEYIKYKKISNDKLKIHKKVIIWAPHHTIANMCWEGINYSTFLTYYETMLLLADKFKDKAEFIFKPHPLLYKKLIKIWGKQKTDDYYKKWQNGVNTNIVLGKYLDLFFDSDAMIHDCGSFTVEYMYTGNPVMYLPSNDNHADNLNAMAKRAYELHYKGFSKSDIEQFIDNVIAGVDPRKEERMEFVNQYLRPPHGKTACENIMNAILGVEEYKDC